MSDSQSSFATSSNMVLEESLALLEQKCVIVEKYMQKVSVLQGKIEELVMEIERLNWENREKEYHGEYISRVSVKQLVCDGFVEVLGVQGSGEICRGGQGRQYENGESNKGGEKQVQGKQSSGRKLVIKIMIDPQLQQILLTDKMHLIKDNPLRQTKSQSQQYITNPSQSQPIHSPSQSHIQQYCQSVMKQVEQMRERLQEQDKINKDRLKRLQEENTILLVSRNKLQVLVEQGRVIYETERLFRDKELEDVRRQKQLRERDVGRLREEVEEMKVKVNNSQEEIKMRSEEKIKMRSEEQINVKHNEEMSKKQLQISELMKRIQQNQQAYDNSIRLQKQINSTSTSLIEQLQKQLAQLQKKHQQYQSQQQQQQKSQEKDNEKQLEQLKLQYQRETAQLSFQINSLKSQHLQQITSLTHQLQELTIKHNKTNEQLSSKSQQLCTKSQQLSTKSTIIQQLQLNLAQLSSQLTTHQQQATHLRNLLSIKQPTIHIIPNTQSSLAQTDPQLIFDMTFLRQTRQKLTPSSIQQHKICLSPSLDMLGFDFDNSVSSSAQNVSNLSINYNKHQLYSNLSSSSFSKNDKHLQQMHTTNMVKVHQEKKSSSQQKIQIPPVNDQDKHHSSQHIKVEDLLNINTSELKQIKLKPKVASYTQKNVIVQEMNEDEDHNEFSKLSVKSNLHANSFVTKQMKSQQSEELRQSRSDLSQSDCERNGYDDDDDFCDQINDRDIELGDSDHPSQTYKNSLILPNRKSPSVTSPRVYQGNSDTHEMSKSLPFKQYKARSPANRPRSFKPSQLLDLKSPQNIMKSLIQKSFPIQKNPFKLSNQYINVGEIIKQENKNANKSSYAQKNKSSNPGSDSLVNIIIQSQDGNDLDKLDEVKRTNTEKDNTLSLTPGTGKGSQMKDESGKNNRIASGQNHVDFITPKKKEGIELAESLDFASLKLLEKENDQNSKSKKKHKIIFLRR